MVRGRGRRNEADEARGRADVSGESVGYELVGAGYALLGVAFIGYGYWRQQVMERALVEGRFVPFDNRAALAFTVAGIVLGVATLAAIVL